MEINGDLYKVLIEDQTEVISRLTADGTFIFVNDVFCRLFGKSQEELLGSRWQPEVFADDLLMVEEQLRTLTPGNPVVVIENRVHSGAGEVCWMQFINRGLFDERGALREIQSVGRDISARKEAEQGMNEALSEAGRFRAALDSVPAYVYMKNPDSRYVYANQPTLELFGCPVEELVGSDDTRFFPPETVRRLREIDARVFRGEQTKEEVDVDDMQGGRCVYWEVKTPIYAGPDRRTIWGLLGISTDITRRKQAEESLRNQAQLLDLTHDSIFVRDLEDRITFWNRGAAMQYGWSAEEAMGKVTHELLVTVFPVPMDRIRATLFETGYWEGRLTHARRDGSLITVDSRWALQRDKDGVPVALLEINNDITDRLKLEEAQLITRKLESIGVLAGGIAHDFNNILTVILGSVSLAKMHEQPGTEKYEWLRKAEDACMHASRLSNKLITFAKGGVSVRGDVRIGKLVRDAVGFALSGSNLLADFSFPDDLPTVHIDVNQMSQVFSNLALNAREAMPKGGRLSVSGESVVVTEGTSPVPGRYVRITVRDQGCGISPDNIGRIFDPYFSTKEMGSRKGQGLGLALCHSIVTRHGGAIRVQSEVGKGTAFSVYLPESGLRPDSEPVAAGVAREGGGTARRILIMDDEEWILSLLDSMLGNFGHRVTKVRESGDAIDAYRAAQAANDPYDAVILDLTIQGGAGGLETMQELRAIDPGVKGIITSGYTDDPILRHHRDHGFVAAITKPYSLDSLRDLLDTVFSAPVL